MVIMCVSENNLELCAEMCAVFNAQKSSVDMTQCTLYTTHHPCLECTKVILQAGIRVVVWGNDRDNDVEHTSDMVYRAKACFK